ncbi:hypothetical protein OKW30_004846 [Paraburkholderia sp. Clong3]
MLKCRAPDSASSLRCDSLRGCVASFENGMFGFMKKLSTMPKSITPIDSGLQRQAFHVSSSRCGLFFVVKPRDCACDPGRSAFRRSRAEGRDGVAEPLAAVHLLDEILVCEALIDHDAPQALLDRMLRHGR